MGEIQLRVYDLSMGLVKLISKPCFNNQINGIWHTSICFSGYEYYFNNSGILKLPIGEFERKNFYLKPLYFVNYQIEDLDQSKFETNVYSFKESFKPNTYHLLNKNCNHFSQIILKKYNLKIPTEISKFINQMYSNPDTKKFAELLALLDW